MIPYDKWVGAKFSLFQKQTEKKLNLYRNTTAAASKLQMIDIQLNKPVANSETSSMKTAKASNKIA